PALPDRPVPRDVRGLRAARRGPRRAPAAVLLPAGHPPAGADPAGDRHADPVRRARPALMTGRVHDLSLPIEAGLPTWPTSSGFSFHQAMAIANGDPANVTEVAMDVHTGTHVESALHFLPDGE